MYLERLALSDAYVSEVVVAVPSRAAWSVARQSERVSACTEAGMDETEAEMDETEAGMDEMEAGMDEMEAGMYETEKVSSAVGIRGGVRVLEWSMKESTPTGCECAAA